MVGRQRAVQRLLPRDRHAVRVRGRAAARHPRATSSTAPTRASISAPTSSPGRTRAASSRDAYQKALDSNAVDYVGVTDFGDYQPADEPTAWFVSPGRAAGPRRRRAGAAVPDLQDQQADDDGQALGRVRHGQDRRDVHRRTRRSDALRLAAVPRGPRGRTSATSSRRAHRPTSPQDAIRQHGTTLVQPVATEATKLAQRASGAR